MEKAVSKPTIKKVSWNTKELNDSIFTVPIYQRRYTWKSEEVEQLLRDFELWIEKNSSGYFLGNIVVEKREENKFDIIDGQQRLTTLYLISFVAEEKPKLKLKYAVRNNDQQFLAELENGFKYENLDKLIKKYNADPVFKTNIETIKRFKEEKNFDLKGLLNKVEFTLTELDPNIVDIEKYFEVMNSRGKQLEKHQVIKARMLNGLDEKQRDTYAKLWDYCSRMDAYLEEFIYNYEKRKYDCKTNSSRQIEGMEDIRKKLLDFAIKEKADVGEFFKENNSPNLNATEDGKLTLDEILSEENTGVYEISEKEGIKEYRSFLKFEYFLLHVLKLYLGHEDDKKIEIHDSKLIVQFQNEFEDSLPEKKIAFLHELFRYRILYDYFLLKRFSETDEPFLAKVSINESKVQIDRKTDNETIYSIMNMQLLFNFTTDFFAQDWIHTVLKWLKSNLNDGSLKAQDNDFYQDYLTFLKSLDRQVALSRLKGDGDLKQLFYQFEENKDDGKQTIDESLIEKQLNRGTSTPHYWFYKLDYILWEKDFLWKNYKNNKYQHPFREEEKFSYAGIKKSFRLSRLNSIEHMKPQSREKDWPQNKGLCEADRPIDCFGNLALVSQHLNSSLLNDENNKKDIIQRQLNRGTIESLKMIDFYSRIKNAEEMTVEKCMEHHQKMIEFLKNFIYQKD